MAEDSHPPFVLAQHLTEHAALPLAKATRNERPLKCLTGPDMAQFLNTGMVSFYKPGYQGRDHTDPGVGKLQQAIGTRHGRQEPTRVSTALLVMELW